MSGKGRPILTRDWEPVALAAYQRGENDHEIARGLDVERWEVVNWRIRNRLPSKHRKGAPRRRS